MGEAVVPDLNKIKQSKTKKKHSKDDSIKKRDRDVKVEQTKKKSKKHSRDDSTKKKSKKSKHKDDLADAKTHPSKKRKHNHPEEEAKRIKVEENPAEQSQISTIADAADKVISASDSDSDNEQEPKQNTLKKKNYVVTNDRILPQLHRVYDDEVDLKTKMKGRNMAFATIKVNNDYYISDSDEESDSDDDYGDPKYEWHGTMGNNSSTVKEKVQSGEWPIKTGRLTLQELLRLEKRIKKIGRRHDLTLAQLRETILDERPSNNMLFWQQILKAFPDRSLLQISTHTKNCYSQNAYLGRWSKEDDEQLLELVKMYDRKFVKIAKIMERTQQACKDRYRSLENKIDRPRTRWSKDEFAQLETAVNEYRQKHGDRISWDYIAKKHFQGRRSAMQLRQKWDHDRKVHDSATVVVRHMQDATVKVQLMLFERMQKKNWASEDAINYGELNDEVFNISKETARRTYFKMRDTLPGFERMKYPDIIDRLVTTRRVMVESLEDA